ncbi:MAG: hypothetical protein ACOC80_11345 [Petrotogales bacterium]
MLYPINITNIIRAIWSGFKFTIPKQDAVINPSVDIVPMKPHAINAVFKVYLPSTGNRKKLFGAENTYKVTAALMIISIYEIPCNIYDIYTAHKKKAKR